MEPLLTICTVAYNQEKFITQTLDGFVMQRTDFKFEAIVGDDCSTDGTAKIISDYARKYPEIIKPVLRTKNIGAVSNSSDVLTKATGKYIALCEGDDYWTDPLKLQKQVDFLEANPEYAICFHPVEILTPDGKLEHDFLTRKVPETTDIYDLAKGNYLHTPSVVSRNDPEVVRDFVSLKSPVGDYVFSLLNAQRGKIKKLTGEMAVYRYGVGVWRPYSPEYHTVLRLLCEYFQEKDRKVYELLKLKKDRPAANYMRVRFQAGDGNGALVYFEGLDAGSKKDLLRYLVYSENTLFEVHASRGWRSLHFVRRLWDILH